MSASKDRRNPSPKEVVRAGGKPKCAAHRTNGEVCGNYPVHGASVCRKHGGGAPQVKAKAAERILAASDMAAGRLIGFMNDERVPYTVRLAATKDLLDRAGVGGREPVKVEVSLFEQLFANASIVYDLEPGSFPGAAADVINGSVVGDAVEAREVAAEEDRFTATERRRLQRATVKAAPVSTRPPGPSVPPSVPYSGTGYKPRGGQAATRPDDEPEAG